MRTAILLSAVLSNSGITSLLIDRLLTDTDAGSVDGTSSEPGPGERVVNADTGSNISIDAPFLVIADTVNTADPEIVLTRNGGGIPRKAGRTFMFYRLYDGDDAVPTGFVGLGSAANPNSSTLIYGIKGRAPYASTSGTIGLPRGDMAYAITLHGDSGGRLYYRIGETWFLAYIFDDDGSADTLWPAILPAVAQYAQLYMLDVPQLAGRYTGATGYLASPAAADTFDLESFGLCAFKVTTLGTSGTTSIELWREDDNNHYRLDISAPSGDMELFSVASGTPTSLDTASGKVSDGSHVVIRRWQDDLAGNYIQVFVDDVYASIAKQYATTYASDTGGKIASVASGGALAALETWPVECDPQPPFVNAMLSQRAWGYIGDSKSTPYDDEWTRYFNVLLEAQTGNRWAATYRQAEAGDDTSDVEAAITASLAAHSGQSPEIVIVNLGANDATSMPTETNYKNDLRSILEQVYAAFGCDIFLINGAWRADQDANCETLRGWNRDVASEYAYTHLGWDEADTTIGLADADDGATYTVEGAGSATHPNEYGKIREARNWRDTLVNTYFDTVRFVDNFNDGASVALIDHTPDYNPDELAWSSAGGITDGNGYAVRATDGSAGLTGASCLDGFSRYVVRVRCANTGAGSGGELKLYPRFGANSYHADLRFGADAVRFFGTDSANSQAITLDVDTWYEFEVRDDNTGNLSLWVDGVQLVTDTLDPSTGSAYLLIWFDNDTDTQIQLDWIKVY